jgi:predicted RNA-binding protein with RPS1 domain
LENEFKIIKINVEEKKVGLSLRAVGQEASRAQVENYKKESHKAPVSSSTTTLGDLLNWKSEKNEQEKSEPAKVEPEKVETETAEPEKVETEKSEPEKSE